MQERNEQAQGGELRNLIAPFEGLLTIAALRQAWLGSGMTQGVRSPGHLLADPDCAGGAPSFACLFGEFALERAKLQERKPFDLTRTHCTAQNAKPTGIKLLKKL